MEKNLQQLTPIQLAIGQGVTFPIELNTRSINSYNLGTKKWEQKVVKGWYPVSGTIDLITGNLQGCLLYQIGERLRQEEFGNNLESCLEEPSTQVLLFYIENIIRTLIAMYENRITYKGISTSSPEPGIFYIRVQYKVKDTPIEEYMDFAISKN